jgi:dihydrofolate reductase
MQGGTTYTFVTDGLEAALAQACGAAGDRDVAVLGGAEIIRQRVCGGLLDEIRLHVVLGGGTALFGGLDPRRRSAGADRADRCRRGDAPDLPARAKPTRREPRQ